MKTLIVIDDEYLLAAGIARMIKKEGLDYEVLGSAADGLSGLKLIREKRPQVTFVDIRMPGMSGLELIERAKEDFPDMVFIIISGYKEFEYARKGLELGCCAYVDKPVTIQKLKTALEAADEMLEKREGDRSAHQKELQKRKLQAIQDEILELVNEKNARGGMEKVREWLTLLREASPELEDFRKECFQFLCAVVASFYDRWKMYEKELSFLSYENVKNLRTFQEAEEYTEMILQRLIEKITVRSMDSSHRIILQILDYINKNYTKDIGLSELANMVDMNAAYLSTLFKEEVGITYVKYLTNVRMEHARELLLKGFTVSEAGSMVGYSNYRYFCDVFKREVGQTPGEYRGNVRKKRQKS